MSFAVSKDEKAYFKALGQRMTKRRQELGLTQAQIADMLGIAQQRYASYEVGARRIQVSMLPSLSEALMIETDVLLGVAPRKKSKHDAAVSLHRHIEQIGRLPKTEQRIVLQMLNGLLAHNR